MSAPPKYRRLNADERRDQLLDVANALLAERGYEEVTVEHIAKSAGVARGLGTITSGGARRSTWRYWSGLLPAARTT